jgi:hypothetical protein
LKPGSSRGAGGAQLVLVGVDADRTASLGGGAALAQRAGPAPSGEAGLPDAVIVAVAPAGQATVPAWGSMRKSPPGVALGSGIGLIVWVWPTARSAAREPPDRHDQLGRQQRQNHGRSAGS